jgi:spore coat protein U-like protein
MPHSFRLLAVCTLFAPLAAFAQNIDVKAHVRESCSITAPAELAFVYDPIADDSDTGRSATGALSVQCTKGTVGEIVISEGVRTNRTMVNDSDASLTLAYDLFTDATHDTRWGSTAGAGKSLTPVGSRHDTQSHTIYGMITAGQDPDAGDYSDTVVVSVNL